MFVWFIAFFFVAAMFTFQTIPNLFHITKFPFRVFVIDIDLITKISKILLDGSSGVVGARPFCN